MRHRTHRLALGTLAATALALSAPPALGFETLAERRAESGAPTESYPGAMIPDRALAPREDLQPQADVRREQLQEPKELEDRLPEQAREDAFGNSDTEQRAAQGSG